MSIKNKILRKYMKHLVFILLAFLFLQELSSQENKDAPSSNSGSSSGKFGLGLTLLGPTGITGKYRMDEKLAIEGSLGFGSFGQGRFHLHGVLLYDFYKVNDSISLYGGGGLVLQERHYGDGRDNGRGRDRIHLFRKEEGFDNSFGIRAPIGLSWKNPDKKFELSAEVYLNLFLTGKERSDLGLALAGRYYF